MDDLANIDSNVIAKLIEVVSDGIGTLYRPRKIRKDADAEAYAIKVTEKAKAEAAAEKRLIEIETEERIARRIAAKEIRRQDNIDYVVERAAQNLLEEGDISDKPVDVDWAARFFEYAQDISVEEMKDLWARILAKEVQKPSSFSLRTLDVLRNISVEEARAFERVANFIIVDSYFYLLGDEELLSRLGVSYMDVALLTECGILQPGEFSMNNYYSSPETDSTFNAFNGKYWIKIRIPKQSRNITFPIKMLSKVGRELLNLVEIEGDKDYIIAFAEILKKANSAVDVQYAEIDLESEGELKTKTPFSSL